jgi:hypothetical protein
LTPAAAERPFFAARLESDVDWDVFRFPHAPVCLLVCCTFSDCARLFAFSRHVYLMGMRFIEQAVARLPM